MWNENKLSAIEFALVFELAKNLAHASLVHTPTEAATQSPRHGRQAECFHHNRVMIAHQVGGELVNDVVAGKHRM